MILLTDDAWEVKKTKEKGRGLFTKKEIPSGRVIGDYLGKVIRTAEEETYENADNFYLMYYHDQASIFPDLKKPGIHLLNHSCAPNCWMYTYKGHTLFFALRRIFPREELTVNYLLSPLDDTCKPCTHSCSCESPICYQTMHLSQKRYDSWSEFHEEESKRTKKKRVSYGRMLPPLDSYPEEISDNPIYTLFGCLNKDPFVANEKMLPSLQKIRSIIRETGRTITFPETNILVLGVLDNLVISKQL